VPARNDLRRESAGKPARTLLEILLKEKSDLSDSAHKRDLRVQPSRESP